MILYSATKKTSIDRLNSEGRGFYSGKTLDELKRQYPDLEQITDDEAYERQVANAITDPVEIDHHRFNELLGVMPPLNWRGDANSESFMLMEPKSGDVHLTLVRVKDRYFEFADRRGLTHAARVQKVANAFPEVQL